MKRLSVLLAAAAVAAYACTSIVPQAVRGSGNLVTKTFDVSDFSEVQLSTIGEVELVQGEEESLVVEAEDNILPLLQIDVRNGTLVMTDRSNAALLPTQPITFRLSAKTINTLVVDSSGSIAADAIQTDTLEVRVTGSGAVDLGEVSADACRGRLDGSGRISIQKLTCKTVKLETTASGEVELAGRTDELTVKSSGSGNTDLQDLEATSVIAHSDASGNVTLWAVESLDVELTGSGNLSYYGKPKVTSTVTGSGKLNALGAH